MLEVNFTDEKHPLCGRNLMVGAVRFELTTF